MASCRKINEQMPQRKFVKGKSKKPSGYVENI